MTSQELNWELSDIFDSGIFVFPVDEQGVARSLVRYLLMRGVLAEEVVDAIEQPGSTADLIAWLSGDERKSMIGVWATAWLNDARRRHDTDRRQRRSADIRPTAPVLIQQDHVLQNRDRRSSSSGKAGVTHGVAERRQMSLDSDFGGSDFSASGGSSKGSIEGVCNRVPTDEIGSAATGAYRRSNSDDNVTAVDRERMTSFPVALKRDRRRAAHRYDGSSTPGRPYSEFYEVDDGVMLTFSSLIEDTTSMSLKLFDSGNVSETTAPNSCECCDLYVEDQPTGSDSDDEKAYVEQPSSVIAVYSPVFKPCGITCRCTLSHYSASASLQTVIYREPTRVAECEPEVKACISR